MRIRRRTVICQQWTEMVTDYLDGALPRGLVRAVDRHLAACPHCTEYLAQIRRTIEVTGRSGLDDAAAMPDDLLDALQRAFDEFRAEESSG
ncbi:MAG: zf-HC2 domain-containing protein [Ilumatobacteraceae bacterium]